MTDLMDSQYPKPEKYLPLKEMLYMRNIADHLDAEYLDQLGASCVNDFERDLSSRERWQVKNRDALELALQVTKAKTFPFVGAANIKFPLITIAALQYHARAYPSLVNSNDVVRYQVFGPDPDGRKNAVGKVISEHMSWQLTEQAGSTWEEDTDRALMVQPIIGCVFKKTYHDPGLKRNKSEMLLPMDLVVDYFTTTLESSPRVTHILNLTHNAIREKVLRGLYLDVMDELPEDNLGDNGLLKEARDRRQGIYDDHTDDFGRPYNMLEQHCWIDLDGDGYQEPYIVTLHRSSGKVLRIVARYFESGVEYNDKGDVVRINATCCFTKIPFIPSPDGGFYDLGFGQLLTPINESINTLLNQIVDSGTLYNTNAGFLGRGIKIKSGDAAFTIGEWKRTDSTGDDLRKSIMPLPVREPSAVLFQLLGFLVGYGERISGATDMAVGVTPGQNTPAETSRTAMEQGLKVFSGIFKRTYRAFKEEFRKLYELNRNYMPEDKPDNPFGITAKIYALDSQGIRPSADPTIMSDSQRLYQAEAMTAASRLAPGYNLYAVQRRYLEALRVTNIDEVLPDPKGPNAIKPPPNPKLLAAQTDSAKVQLQAHKQQADNQQQQFDMKMEVAKLLQNAEFIKAKISKLEADSQKSVAQARGVQSGHDIGVLNAELAISKAKHKAMLDSIKILHEAIRNERTDERAMADVGQGQPDTNMEETAGNGSGGVEGALGGG